jgi:hypothetical protein
MEGYVYIITYQFYHNNEKFDKVSTSLVTAQDYVVKQVEASLKDLRKYDAKCDRIPLVFDYKRKKIGKTGLRFIITEEGEELERYEIRRVKLL